MSFSLYDFQECVKHCDVTFSSKPIKVLKGWGVGGREHADWTGGFVLQLEDKSFGYLSGWSDSSGWG